MQMKSIKFVITRYAIPSQPTPLCITISSSYRSY